MEQMKLFDDGPYQKSTSKTDKLLYTLICDELQNNDGMSSSDAHLAANDIVEKIRKNNLICDCGGNCGCRK